MTGFGRGEYLEDGLRITVEIKSVNHRYNDINIRMPRSLNAFEDRIRKLIATKLSRGKIDVGIFWQETDASNKAVTINRELAKKYFAALKELSAELPQANFNVGIHQLALYPEVMQCEVGVVDENTVWRKLGNAVTATLEKINEMRATEGTHICADIIARVELLTSYIDDIDRHAPAIVEEHRNKLLQKMREVLDDTEKTIDETRILQEAALFAERTNFTEELVRLRSHVKQLETTLKSSGGIGKKLDFLVQEINREINTIGSKCNDYITSAIVVEMKSETEKIREQIQNVE
jgi:uncharacterized protein (TIGR00255 family)